MSGSTPFTARSPTQSNQYPPYSPTHPNRPFYSHHEPFQIPSQHLTQTTPPFPPASMAQSPLHNRPPPTLASPLPAPNALAPPPLPTSSLYQLLPQQLRLSSNGYLVNAMPSYEDSPTHAHPSAHSPPPLQSPIREQHNLSNGRHNDAGVTESRPLSKDVSCCLRNIELFTHTLPQKPDRTSNPMSFASILGPSNNEPSPKPSESKLPRPSTPPPKPVMDTKKAVDKHESRRLASMDTNGTATNGYAEVPSKLAFNVPTQRDYVAPSKPRKMATDGEADRILKALALIDETTYHDTDVGFHEFKELFKQRSRKRKADVEESESRKKKVHCHFCTAPRLHCPTNLNIAPHNILTRHFHQVL